MPHHGIRMSLLVAVVNSLLNSTPALPARNHEDTELKFFQRIQELHLDWDEIIGSYKNVSAEMETVMCRSKCKTAAALWVLQDFKPCEVIEKVDCPKGLVCCTSDELDDERAKARSTPPPHEPSPDVAHDDDRLTELSDNESEHTAADSKDQPITAVPFIQKLDDMEDLFYPQPILDPIPNDDFP